MAAGYGSSGCAGGSSDSAIQYNYKVFQTTEALYPATYSDGESRTSVWNGAPGEHRGSS